MGKTVLGGPGFLLASAMSALLSWGCSPDSVRPGIAGGALEEGPGAPPRTYRCAMSRALHDVQAIAVDHQGAIVLATRSASARPTDRSLIRKLSADGGELWSFPIQTEEDFVLTGVAVDLDGSVIVGGVGSRATREANGKVRAERGIVLLKLAPGGSPLWSRFEAQDATFARVAVAPAGDIVVAGRLRAGADKSAFAARYDAAARPRWYKAYPGETARASDVAVDDAGNVVVGGRFASTWDFGGGPLTPVTRRDDPGVPDAFLVKYGPSGQHVWSRRFGDERAQNVRRVAVDPRGHIVVLASTWGAIDFGGGPVGTWGTLDGNAVAVIDEHGDHLWSHAFPGAVDSVGLDASSAITIVGQFAGAIELGVRPIVEAADPPTYVARLDLAGRPLARARLGDSRGLSLTKVAFGRKGTVVLAGRLEAPLDLGCGTLQPAPDADQFVVALTPDLKGEPEQP